jgi:hypothetical protein
MKRPLQAAAALATAAVLGAGIILAAAPADVEAGGCYHKPWKCPTPTATATPDVTPTPTQEPEPTPTATPDPTPEPTAEPTPTATPTEVPPDTCLSVNPDCDDLQNPGVATPAPSSTPEATPTATPEATVTATATPPAPPRTAPPAVRTPAPATPPVQLPPGRTELPGPPDTGSAGLRAELERTTAPADGWCAYVMGERVYVTPCAPWASFKTWTR